jgi:hypothetical protein
MLGEWHKGYFVIGSARRQWPIGWLSNGKIYAPGRVLTKIQTVNGEQYPTFQEAERHGLALAKKWIDQQLFWGSYGEDNASQQIR